MSAYLVSFRPLAISKIGRSVASEYQLPLYIDSSCRREPDLQSEYPSISAICRGGRFAPRLQVGDHVLYITVKSSFGENALRHRKAVAHLEVIERFETHQQAAAWYKSKNLPLPSNCFVSGNLPIDYGRTGQSYKKTTCSTFSKDKLLGCWDDELKSRAKKHGVFLVCRSIWQELSNPPALSDEDFIKVFNRVPGTQNPPQITIQQLESLKAIALQRNVG